MGQMKRRNNECSQSWNDAIEKSWFKENQRKVGEYYKNGRMSNKKLKEKRLFGNVPPPHVHRLGKEGNIGYWRNFYKERVEASRISMRKLRTERKVAAEMQKEYERFNDALKLIGENLERTFSQKCARDFVDVGTTIWKRGDIGMELHKFFVSLIEQNATDAPLTSFCEQIKNILPDSHLIRLDGNGSVDIESPVGIYNPHKKMYSVYKGIKYDGGSDPFRYVSIDIKNGIESGTLSGRKFGIVRGGREELTVEWNPVLRNGENKHLEEMVDKLDYEDKRLNQLDDRNKKMAGRLDILMENFEKLNEEDKKQARLLFRRGRYEVTIWKEKGAKTGLKFGRYPKDGRLYVKEDFHKIKVGDVLISVDDGVVSVEKMQGIVHKLSTKMLFKRVMHQL